MRLTKDQAEYLAKERSNIAKDLLRGRKEVNNKLDNTIVNEINKIESDHKRKYVLDGKGDLSEIAKQKKMID